MNDIIEILNKVKKGIDYENEKHLISDRLLSSFDIVLLVSLLNDEFGIEITVMDIMPENFESLESINNLVNRLK